MKKSYHSNKKIIETLEKTMGNISKAAKILGYKGHSLRSKISTDEELRLAKNEIVEGGIERLEDKLQEHIEQGSLDALKFKLNGLAKHKGYGSNFVKMEVDGQVEHKHSIDEALLEKFRQQLVEPEEEENG